jgi:hypothetical protein
MVQKVDVVVESYQLGLLLRYNSVNGWDLIGRNMTGGTMIRE